MRSLVDFNAIRSASRRLLETPRITKTSLKSLVDSQAIRRTSRGQLKLVKKAKRKANDAKRKIGNTKIHRSHQ